MTVLGEERDLDVIELRRVCEVVARDSGALASAARARASGYSPGPLTTVETKSSPSDLVTQIDRDVDDFVRELLGRERPGEKVRSEERGGAYSEWGITWVVDPIDGTVNFVRGLPFWAVSIAAVYRGITVAACVHAPALGWTFIAAEGHGAYWRDGTSLLSPLVLDDKGTFDLAAGLVATGLSYNAVQKAKQGRLLPVLIEHSGDIRRCGSAALDLCMVAAGVVDAYFEHGLSDHDWRGGGLIAQEAGALVRLPAEESCVIDDGLGTDCVFASAPHVEADLERLLRAGGAAELSLADPAPVHP
ncbi:inositol monophosphatase [Crossiella sp. SN42]|uniref:inositol monophosphatase family protein n=1 Tax=Crossiella sp. SN42 TaxID=2944808 RepID=UPI00207CA93B|nr:inositol monophosphatase family protein [Crossiella sp. SN42]MCO1575574.1 inositol monophosphatase [Crossiella sp. SN42]